MTDLRDRTATVLRDNLAVSRFEADSMADAATKELRRRECAESYQSDTEKHLRDRVAQTLYRRYAPQLGMADNPWEDEHSLTQEMWREDADAVIRELETSYVLVPKSNTLADGAAKEPYGCQLCDCSCCYGYEDCHCVTDPCNCGMTGYEHGRYLRGKLP